ncbi:DHPS isoform 15, partial [Pongo abelii]
ADLTQSRRPLTSCTIFLGYTSNLISSGIRGRIGDHSWRRGGRPHQVPGAHVLRRV